MNEPNPQFDRTVLPALLSFRDGQAGFVAPSVASVQARARGRERVRLAVAASAVGVVLMAAGLMFAMQPRRDGSPLPPADSPTASTAPASPSPSVSPSPSESPAPPLPDIATTRWSSATVLFPPAVKPYDQCPAGLVTFGSGRVVVRGKVVAPQHSNALAYGDLDGDGRPEAAFPIHCENDSPDESGDGSGHLIVVTQRADGSLATLAFAGPIGQNTQKLRISGGRLILTVEQRQGVLVQERTYRWNGTAFEQIAGPTSFPDS
jgi:hypothetical protein